MDFLVILHANFIHHCYLFTGCNTSYEHDYSVNANMRTYYDGIPDVIEVGEHQFVEREVLNLFTGLMLLSWLVLSTLESD